MASVNKFNSKNPLKISLNETNKIIDNIETSIVGTNIRNLTKEKSNDKMKLKISENQNNNYPNITSPTKNQNILYLENKQKNSNFLQNFKNSFCHKFIKSKPNAINVSTNNNSKNHKKSSLSKKNNLSMNSSLKNNQDLIFKNIPFIDKMKVNNKLYLSTEPEILHTIFANLNTIPKNFSSNNAKKISNNNNSFNNSSLYGNYLKTNPNINNNSLLNNITNTSNYDNNKTKHSNHLILNKIKKSSGLFNSYSRSSNINNLSYINLNNQSYNYYSNSKNNRKQTKNVSNLSNPHKGKNSSISNKTQINNLEIETYSSPKDFIEDFFEELEKYCNNIDDCQAYNINRINILKIFDNIFKNIITGEKPMESLDIHIKKKLKNYSETWKKFLFNFEKMSIKINNSNNQNFINNIDFSTKNVINHNHNHNHNHNSFDCVNDTCSNKCYQNLKSELEEKFTNMMKNEVNKINRILNEKEKIIEDLKNQINIKNSYISEIQESLINIKSKEGLTSHSNLISDQFSNNINTLNPIFINNNKNINKTLNSNINYVNNNSIYTNLDKNFQKQKPLSPFSEQNDHSRQTLSNNNFLENNNSDLIIERDTINKIDILEFKKNSNSKNDQQNSILNNLYDMNLNENNKITDKTNNQNELSLYDQKQFIRERNLLINENKNLFEKINDLERILNFQKEKEIKLMKVLFFLNKQGIPIDEIIKNQILTEKSSREEISQINRENENFTPLESCKSMDSLMFLPITLEKPNFFLKPQAIPNLNLKNINNKFNMEYESPKKLHQKLIMNCFTEPDFQNNNQNNLNISDYHNNNYFILQENQNPQNILKKSSNSIQNGLGEKIKLDKKYKNNIENINNNKLLKDDLNKNSSYFGIYKNNFDIFDSQFQKNNKTDYVS